MTNDTPDLKRMISMAGMWEMYFTLAFIREKVKAAMTMYHTPLETFISTQNLTILQNDLSVCSICELLVVRDDDKCLIEFFLQIKKQLVQFLGIFRIKIAARFIGKNQ